MINQDLLDRLISLINQNLVQVSDIKNTEYSAAVLNYYKSEVTSGTITADQYKQITGQTYTA